MDEDQKGWFAEFIAAVESDVCDGLLSDGRFTNAQTLITRFRDAAERLLDGGLDHLNEFNEVLNEIGVAHQILATEPAPRAAALDYEPSMSSCDQRIDFRVALDDGGTVLYVEVKTIHPDFKGRWEQYRWVLENDLLPSNVHYHLDEDWLGGEFWHFRVASRSKMLQYTRDFEDRIRNCLGAEPGAATVLALCGDGNRWHEDELQDFVAFYRSGVHRPDDAMALMEKHHIQQNNIGLDRSIQHFTFVERSNQKTSPRRVVWSVTPPPITPFGLPGD